jgi:hypothetical protein
LCLFSHIMSTWCQCWSNKCTEYFMRYTGCKSVNNVIHNFIHISNYTKLAIFPFLSAYWERARWKLKWRRWNHYVYMWYLYSICLSTHHKLVQMFKGSQFSSYSLGLVNYHWCHIDAYQTWALGMSGMIKKANVTIIDVPCVFLRYDPSNIILCYTLYFVI